LNKCSKPNENKTRYIGFMQVEGGRKSGREFRDEHPTLEHQVQLDVRLLFGSINYVKMKVTLIGDKLKMFKG